MEDKESKILVTTSKKGENIKSVKTIVGCPIIFATSAKVFPNDENVSRFNVTSLDTSREQTRRTFFKKKIDKEPDKTLIDELNTFKSYYVDIPDRLFNKIAKIFPDNNTKYRRYFPRFIDFVRVCAIINSKDRKFTNGDILVATKADYNMAVSVLKETYFTQKQIVDLDLIDKDILEIVRLSNLALSINSISQTLGEKRIAKQNVYPRVYALRDRGLLKETEARDVNGNLFHVYSIINQEEKNPFDLPKL
jgi:hypothetical protein